MKLVMLAAGALACTGCHGFRSSRSSMQPLVVDAPKELDKATLPAYRVEPPDVLSIDVVQHVPESLYNLHVGDTVMLTVLGTLPDEPIAGVFPIETGGVIQLGFGYGRVEVAGLTVSQATQLITQHLKTYLRDPQVSIALRDVVGMQRISGEHMVGPDGTITLGKYGSVYVVGMTLDDVRLQIANHLAPNFVSPEVSVSVYAYNSKNYYVVTQGGGLGDNLVRLPYTGNETVMDAISQINGLSHVSSTKIWVARPGTDAYGRNQILPVDWIGITQRGEVATNYQMLPGDRLYIAENQLVAFDGALGKITSPFERIFGFTLLGTTTASRLSGKVLMKTPGNSYAIPPAP